MNTRYHNTTRGTGAAAFGGRYHSSVETCESISMRECFDKGDCKRQNVRSEALGARGATGGHTDFSFIHHWIIQRHNSATILFKRTIYVALLNGLRYNRIRMILPQRDYSYILWREMISPLPSHTTSASIHSLSRFI